MPTAIKEWDLTVHTLELSDEERDKLNELYEKRKTAGIKNCRRRQIWPSAEHMRRPFTV